MKKNAFTMIELVFVIVVLGILASVAIPKLAATRDDAIMSKTKATIASVRAAIVNERQVRLIRGDSDWITQLHSTNTSFFDDNGSTANGLLMYGVEAENKDGAWQPTPVFTVATGTWAYKVKVLKVDNTFTYDPSDGTFICVVATAPSCARLTR